MDKGKVDFTNIQQQIHKARVSDIHCLQEMQRVLLKYTVFNAIQQLCKIITRYSADYSLLIAAEAG